MINRVLIRIKVIQLLYSYLLTEKVFQLESQPEHPTKEKRFAYQAYLDMLVLMVQVARRIAQRGGRSPLAENKFIVMVQNDEKIRSLLTRYEIEHPDFYALVPDLATEVKESGIYKTFLRKKDADLSAEMTLWRNLFDIVFMSYQPLMNVLAQRENYSMRGMDRMRNLINDTFLNFFTAQDHITDAVKLLKHSLGESRDLYFRLLWLPVDLTDLRMQQIDSARNKYLPTESDLNPNMNMIDNSLVEAIRNNPVIEEYRKKHDISWTSEPLLLASLLKTVVESEDYKEYCSKPVADRHEDVDFWRNIYKHVIFYNPDFLEALEDKSIFWNDDIDIIGTFMLKTMRRFDADETDNIVVLDMFKDREDAEFGDILFTDVVKNKAEYRNMLDSFVNKEQWDTERLAFMDVVVIMTAISELLNFPKIPVKVTINEYVELAKSYSTAKSGAFINGMLASIVTRLREEGRLLKD